MITVGTDSYVSVVDADTYFSGRLYAGQWTGATAVDKEKALRMAARILNRQRFIGTITSTAQLLAWPRRGVVDYEGRPLNESAVPAAIIEAQCELALRLLTDDLTEDDGTRGVRVMAAGGVRMEYDGRAPERALPDYVMALVSPFLAAVPTSASALLVP